MKKGGKLGKLQFEQIKNPGSFGVVGKFPRKFSETRKTVELTKCNLFDRKKSRNSGKFLVNKCALIVGHLKNK